jgi:uncharacterized protein
LKKRTKKLIWIFLIILISYRGACYIYDHYYSKSIVLSPLNADQITSCNQFHGDKDKSTVRILIVDGGGVDGIMPLVLLKYLEEKTNKPTSELFDFFTGTSTGSIIVSLLNIPNATGQSRYSANEVLSLYTTVSKKVLTPSWIRRIFTINGLFSPHLSIKLLHKGFTEILGQNITFGNLMKHVSITTFNLLEKRLTMLNSWECNSPVTRYPVADIISAAVATPAFFSPVKFTNIKNNQEAFLIDGMIFANNPSLQAINEAFILYPNAKKFIVIHLGTGGDSINYLKLSGDRTNGWGLARWIYPMISILYKEQNKVIENAITSIQYFSSSTKFHYSYFNKNLEKSSPFDTSNSNIENILKTAEELLDEQKDALDEVAEKLS